MGRERKNGGSRGLVIYTLLLQLYPPAYLRRHRAELLQNFQDLERAMPSRVALWLFIARDLAVSLGSELTRTLWGQTTIRFAILALMLAMVHRHAGQREQSAWTFCCGYAFGWFTGWFGWDWRMSASGGSPLGFVRSFRGQAAMLLGAIAIVLTAGTYFPDLQKRLVFASCYGAAIAWLAGWWTQDQRSRQ
jgi:hypothetical protein